MIPRRQAILYAGLSVFAALLWQWTTVTVNYKGNWTALFCTGSLRGVPSSLSAEHVYQFPGSTGYDGQFYHYIAHDPLIRNAELKSFVDAPRFRYRRILLPGLAWILALGQNQWIDRAYFTVSLLWVAAGVYWGCLLCRGLGRSAAWGLLFVFTPAVLISVDRLVADAALAALTVGFMLHCRHAGRRLFAILAAAALTRETGFFLIAGYCGWLLLNRHWRAAGRYSLAAIPALFWYAYVDTRTEPFDLRATGFVPLRAFVQAIRFPDAYPLNMPMVGLVRAADLLALAGVLFAFVLAAVLMLRRQFQPEFMAGFCFALAGIFFQRADHWTNVYHFGRVYTPLLIVLAVHALRIRSPVWMLPWLLMLPRIGMQFAPQLLATMKAVVSG